VGMAVVVGRVEEGEGVVADDPGAAVDEKFFDVYRILQ
jgi:hypothetical protein